MAPGLALRVSWICLLLSCAAAFPATKGDYKYPYTATWSNSGSSGSSHSPSGGSHPLMMPLSQAQAPAPAQATSYVRPPTAPAKKAPSFSPVQPQPAGAWAAASRFAPSHGNAPAVHMGDGPMPYRGGSSAGSPVLHMGDGPMPYRGGSSAGYGHGPMPYGGPAPDASLRPAQPAGEAYVSAPGFLPLPHRPFPEFTWEAVPETPSETPSETSPLLPSTYIIQTSNGFQRARDFHSHMQYSPEYLPPPIDPPTENTAPSNPPSKLPPSGAKGTKYHRG